jgi:hypothetical protein
VPRIPASEQLRPTPNPPDHFSILGAFLAQLPVGGADAYRAATAAAEAGFPVGGVGDPAVGTQRRRLCSSRASSSPEANRVSSSTTTSTLAPIGFDIRGTAESWPPGDRRPRGQARLDPGSSVSIRVDQRNRDIVARRFERHSGVPRSRPPMRTTESASIRVIYVILSGQLQQDPSLGSFPVEVVAWARRRTAADCRRQTSAPNLDSSGAISKHFSRTLGPSSSRRAVTDEKKVHGIRTALDCPSSVVSRPMQGLSSDLARRRSGPFLFARMLDEMGHAVLGPLAGGRRRLRRLHRALRPSNGVEGDANRCPRANPPVGFVARQGCRPRFSSRQERCRAASNKWSRSPAR